MAQHFMASQKLCFHCRKCKCKLLYDPLGNDDDNQITHQDTLQTKYGNRKTITLTCDRNHKNDFQLFIQPCKGAAGFMQAKKKCHENVFYSPSIDMGVPSFFAKSRAVTPEITIYLTCIEGHESGYLMPHPVGG